MTKSGNGHKINNFEVHFLAKCILSVSNKAENPCITIKYAWSVSNSFFFCVKMGAILENWNEPLFRVLFQFCLKTSFWFSIKFRKCLRTFKISIWIRPPLHIFPCCVNSNECIVTIYVYIYIWSCSSFNPLRAKLDILCKTVLLHIPIHFEQPISPFLYIMIYNINKPNYEL